MKVNLILLHMNGVEVIRKGETKPRALFCPFSSRPAFIGHPENLTDHSMNCGPWCPFFGEPEKVFEGPYNHQVHVGWKIELSCKGGMYPACLETDEVEGFHDGRPEEQSDYFRNIEKQLEGRNDKRQLY